MCHTLDDITANNATKRTSRPRIAASDRALPPSNKATKKSKRKTVFVLVHRENFAVMCIDKKALASVNQAARYYIFTKHNRWENGADCIIYNKTIYNCHPVYWTTTMLTCNIYYSFLQCEDSSCADSSCIEIFYSSRNTDFNIFYLYFNVERDFIPWELTVTINCCAIRTIFYISLFPSI